MPQRTRPLSAELELLDDLDLDVDPVDPASAAERQARFSEGIRTLKVGSASTALFERILLLIGGVLAPLGLVVVVLGWWGASRTSYSFEQTPYLISGGLLGLGLVFLGSFFYFAHWLTRLVKEHREQSAAILAALERLSVQLEAPVATPPRRRSAAR